MSVIKRSFLQARHFSNVTPFPILGATDVRRRTRLDPKIYHSFYSSYLGGIVTDPGLAAIPVDCHGFHRGHCVFDTLNVVDGQAFNLEVHLDRLLTSAFRANIRAPPKDELRNIILQTVAAGQQQTAFVRYWLTAGRGNFGISSGGLSDAGFFVVVCDEFHTLELEAAIPTSIVGVPLKPQQLAIIKSNNYLLNALVQDEAETRDATAGIQLDEKGFLAESSVSTIAITTADKKLVLPPFDDILTSTTIGRLKELLPLACPDYEFVQRAVSVQELTEQAVEVLIFSGHYLRSVGSIDSHQIGDGGVGPVSRVMQQALMTDMKSNASLRTDVPFHLYAPTILTDEE